MIQTSEKVCDSQPEDVVIVKDNEPIDRIITRATELLEAWKSTSLPVLEFLKIVYFVKIIAYEGTPPTKEIIALKLALVAGTMGMSSPDYFSQYKTPQELDALIDKFLDSQGFSFQKFVRLLKEE
jgi:hypothetical protein